MDSIKNGAFNNFSIYAYIFVAAVRMPNNNNNRGIHIQTHRLMERMYEEAEMGSDAMIYIPVFIQIDSRIQKLIWGRGTIYRQHGDLISLLLIFQNKEKYTKN
jgi:hypothetical protein